MWWAFCPKLWMTNMLSWDWKKTSQVYSTVVLLIVLHREVWERSDVATEQQQTKMPAEIGKAAIVFISCMTGTKGLVFGFVNLLKVVLTTDMNISTCSVLCTLATVQTNIHHVLKCKNATVINELNTGRESLTCLRPRLKNQVTLCLASRHAGPDHPAQLKVSQCNTSRLRQNELWEGN